MPWRSARGSIRANCGLQKGSDPARNELGCVRQVGWLQGSEWEGISDGQRTARCVLLSQGAANCSQSAADLGPPSGEGALGSPLQPGATEPLALHWVFWGPFLFSQVRQSVSDTQENHFISPCFILCDRVTCRGQLYSCIAVLSRLLCVLSTAQSTAGFFLCCERKQQFTSCDFSPFLLL